MERNIKDVEDAIENALEAIEDIKNQFGYVKDDIEELKDNQKE